MGHFLESVITVVVVVVVLAVAVNNIVTEYFLSLSVSPCLFVSIYIGVNLNARHSSICCDRDREKET